MGDKIKDMEKAILESVLAMKKQKPITNFFQPIYGSNVSTFCLKSNVQS